MSTRAELLAAMTRLARRYGLSNPQADELLERCHTVAEMEQAVAELMKGREGMSAVRATVTIRGGQPMNFEYPDIQFQDVSLLYLLATNAKVTVEKHDGTTMVYEEVKR